MKLLSVLIHLVVTLVNAQTLTLEVVEMASHVYVCIMFPVWLEFSIAPYANILRSA